MSIRESCFECLAFAVISCDPASAKHRANAGHNPERLCLMKARTTLSRCTACNSPQGIFSSRCYLISHVVWLQTCSYILSATLRGMSRGASCTAMR